MVTAAFVAWVGAGGGAAGAQPTRLNPTTSGMSNLSSQASVRGCDMPRMVPRRPPNARSARSQALKSPEQRPRMALELPRHKFTHDEYQQMGVSGIFTEDDRVELLDGDIVEMSPIGPRHAYNVGRLNMLLAPLLVGRAIVHVQNPLQLDVHWEPQPDVSILRLRDGYESELPTGADVLLL